MSAFSLLTLALLISFPSVNAVLYTPALPAIADFFHISDGVAQYTISYFLIGYTAGQLIYGPLANRFGRKNALLAGVGLQILSSLMCALASLNHQYAILVFGRFLLALGSGVGLKMTFTIINEMYEPKQASRILSYLIIAFALMPALSVMAGGILITHFDWSSTFYAGALYGALVLACVTALPKTDTPLDINAFKLSSLWNGYLVPFKDTNLVTGGLIIGGATCCLYLFSTLAPFIAITKLHMPAIQYGSASFITAFGLLTGSLLSAQLLKKYASINIIYCGLFIAFLGSLLMLGLTHLYLPAIYCLFIPTMICYIGLSFVFANTSSIAMQSSTDKANASAVMNFINIGFATVVMFLVGKLSIQVYLLPLLFLIVCSFMLGLMKYLARSS